MKRLYGSLLFGALVSLGSCSADQESDEQTRARGDHVWKDQVEAIDKAGRVEDMLKDESEKNKDELERQTR